MVSKEDWQAAISSEVFREYVKGELAKKSQSSESPREDLGNVVDTFEKLEKKINKNPKMKKAFRALREKFLKDAEYREQTKSAFVDGVMLLNLDE